MDDTLLFIPPCCVDKKLPKAIMQAPRRTLTFYTQGDVTMEKFFRAVSYLLDESNTRKENYCVMVLSMPTLLGETVVFLQQCFERRWITHLVLSTHRKADAMLDIHLQEYWDRILYTATSDVSESTSHMALYNSDKALVLVGPMLERMSAKMAAYSLVFYPDQSTWSNAQDWGNPLKNVCFPDVLRHRQQVAKGKREVRDRILSRFLKGSFPPYAENQQTERPIDHYNFGQV